MLPFLMFLTGAHSVIYNISNLIVPILQNKEMEAEILSSLAQDCPET